MQANFHLRANHSPLSLLTILLYRKRGVCRFLEGTEPRLPAGEYIDAFLLSSVLVSMFQ